MITHLNKQGNPKMVDVSDKVETLRIATARSIVSLNEEAYDILKKGYSKKGDILSVAQTAGIMAAKKTSEIIPMCHQIPLSGIDIEYEFVDALREIYIVSRVRTNYKTGVEMEALTASSVAALTIYDMLKAIDHSIVIKETLLLEKIGGKSGYKR